MGALKPLELPTDPEEVEEADVEEEKQSQEVPDDEPVITEEPPQIDSSA
jgi:hypothetical protein